MHNFNVVLWAGATVAVELSELPIVTLDGNVLDPRIVDWAIQYGFRQGIRDAAANEKNDELRNAKAMKRVDALIDNTLRDAVSANRLTPVEREMRVIVADEVRASFEKPENQAWIAKQRAATKMGITELREATAKAILRDQDARLRAKAEYNLANREPIDTIDLSAFQVEDAA